MSAQSDEVPWPIKKLIEVVFAPFRLAKMARQKRSGYFTKLERQVLDTICSELDSTIAAAIRSQLSEINLVERVTTYFTETSMYKVNGISIDHSRRDLLPIPMGEQQLAIVSVDSDLGLNTKAKVIAYDRCILLITFGDDVTAITDVNAKITVKKSRYKTGLK